MSEENVVHIPLPTRREKIERLLDRNTRNAKDWVDIQLGLAFELNEAKTIDCGNDTNVFHKWLVDNDFGDDKISKDDRAAYLALALDLELAKEVLLASERRSVRLIEKNEYRELYQKKHAIQGEGVRNVAKSPRKAKAAPQVDHAYEEIRRRKQMGKKLPPQRKLAEEIGVSHATVEKGMYRVQHEEAEAKVTEQADEEALANARFSEKSVLTVNKAIEIYKKKINKTFWKEVDAEVRKQIDSADNHLRVAHKKLEEEKATWDTREAWWRQEFAKKGVFTPVEYKQLLMCIHPDNTASIEVRNKITDIVKKAEMQLMIPESAEAFRQRKPPKTPQSTASWETWRMKKAK
jgi:DNA-binding transcriptional regulator YhcF (GntR family)